MNVRFHPVATVELEEAAQWYEAHRMALRDEFLAEFRTGIGQVIEQPHAWQQVGAGARRYRLGRFPYGIVYIVEDDQIVVLAVAHLRRNPGYWEPRLQKKL
jgi:plasmid stabilization system protein ParE